MPDPKRRHRQPVATAWAAVLGAVVLLVLGPGPAAAAPPRSYVDFDAVVQDLQDDHVALVGDTTDTEADFAPIVADARSHNVNLSIVVLGSEPVDVATTQDVATAVLGGVRGTVLVLGPHSVGIASDAIGDAEIAAATDAANGISDDVGRARAVVGSLTARSFPWATVLIVALLTTGIAGARRRARGRRGDDHDGLADLTTGLAQRVDDLTPVVGELARRARQTGRHDLEDRADRAAESCTRLGDLTAQPLGTRRDVDAAAAQVAALTVAVGALQTDIDGVLLPPAGDQPRS